LWKWKILDDGLPFQTRMEALNCLETLEYNENSTSDRRNSYITLFLILILLIYGTI
jgi:predicted nucleic acid-binding Zn ribbon protein